MNQPSLSPHSQDDSWRQGELIEIEIVDLSDTSEGVGRWGSRVVFVPDTVTGDRAEVRLVHVKPNFARGQLHRPIEPSDRRTRPRCIVADKCGGCQWQHVAYEFQLETKRQLVREAIARIGGIPNPPVEPVLVPHTDGESPSPLGYRNKATYPLSVSSQGRVQAGYYRKGSHRLVNLNQCPVQDPRLNPLLAQVKQDIQDRGWSIYNSQTHRGLLRHLSLQIGRRTGEILLTLVVTDWEVPEIEAQAQQWRDRYPSLVGVCLNRNPRRTNAILGNETRTVSGRDALTEQFAGVKLQVRADTFFQVNTETAEALFDRVLERLNLRGDELAIDAYCGIGTFTLPLAKRVRRAIGLEVSDASIACARANAELNGLSNVEFYQGAVETLLSQPESLGLTGDRPPDLVLLDPPRKGCDRAVLEGLLELRPRQLVYISCKPATLARDLKILCEGGYRLTTVQPADFFPQTSHVESAAFLEWGVGGS
ncbi:23S rRNA (uracil(1939)-C(5))-methyltransferase RlmD [Oxynema sp. CENA135]|uniref:23S rRNA (uracil(1939)-C(5))-methyltransferase RlmD n=1 Tax=Oxynema sp. CENA135 TaxID=984206 RepID=UPI00190C73AA|nr:23S rRNA (uracil(1939)-C(5))-methyltransferase RlmD [Oxynema sp. CENA135]MBK4732856.1 23S rRNA (uracil(1939)-C(5))-methyltransferase RlmD [Oxynema sp. CENA135]